MTEHEDPTPDTAPETDAEVAADATETPAPARRSPWEIAVRYAGTIRATLLVMGLLAVWALLVVWWTDSSSYGEPLFDAARVAITFVALCLSAVWIASIKVPRLRYALRPLEAGVVVGAAVLAVILVVGYGTEVDTIDDAAFIATFVGFMTALVVACVERLTTNEGSALRWGGGVMVAAVVLGGLLPALADRITNSNDGSDPAIASAYAMATSGVPVLARVQGDGGFRIDPMGESEPGAAGVVDGVSANGSTSAAYSDPAGTVYDAATGQPVPSPSSHDGDVYGEVPAIPGQEGSIPGLKAIVRAGGKVDVVLPALAQAKARIEVEVRRGECGVVMPAGSTALDAWTIRDGTRPTTHKRSFSLDDIDDTGLSLLTSSGGPWSPTVCQQLVSTRAVSLAKADGAAFAQECLAHARLDSAQIQALTPQSFQDAKCASRLTDLEALASSPIASIERVERAVACLSERGVGAQAIGLDANHAALEVDPFGTEEEVQAGFECGFDGSGTLSPEGGTEPGFTDGASAGGAPAPSDTVTVPSAPMDPAAATPCGELDAAEIAAADAPSLDPECARAFDAMK